MDEEEEVSELVYEPPEHGNGAARQRRVFERAVHLADTADMLIKEKGQRTGRLKEGAVRLSESPPRAA